MTALTRLLFGWLDRLPAWLRAGVITGFWAATIPFVAASMSWLEGFFQWAAGEPGVTFPDISVLRSAVVGLASGAVIGGGNAIARFVQERVGTGKPPIYTAQIRAGSDRGQSTRAIAVTALVVAVVVLILVL